MAGKSIIQAIESKLKIRILKVMPVSGGSINQTYCLQSEDKRYFIKINDNDKFPGMFEAEARGLKLIASTNSLSVPEIILQGQSAGESYLLLEWIDTKPADAYTSGLMGVRLARMHKNTTEHLELDYDNYMGSLPQSNKYHDTWTSFFTEERLKPMVKLALNKQLLNGKDIAGFEKLYKSLPGLFNEEAPSLIHGDLWSGNYMISANGSPYLIDPAVCYGNREFDVAMTTLFGGFSREFYDAYDREFPLNKGWEGRLALWNLYPLLLHLNLFGTGYLSRVRNNLSRYV